MILTMGVDTQDDRFVYEAVGWMGDSHLCPVCHKSLIIPTSIDFDQVMARFEEEAKAVTAYYEEKIRQGMTPEQAFEDYAIEVAKFNKLFMPIIGDGKNE